MFSFSQLQGVLIGAEVIMLNRFTVIHLAALHYAGMHSRIQYNQVVFGQDALQRGAVRSITGGVNDAVFLSEKSRDHSFQLLMVIIMSADGRRCACARSIFYDAINRGLLYCRV